MYNFLEISLKKIFILKNNQWYIQVSKQNNNLFKTFAWAFWFHMETSAVPETSADKAAFKLKSTVIPFCKTAVYVWSMNKKFA